MFFFNCLAIERLEEWVSHATFSLLKFQLLCCSQVAPKLLTFFHSSAQQFFLRCPALFATRNILVKKVDRKFLNSILRVTKRCSAEKLIEQNIPTSKQFPSFTEIVIHPKNTFLRNLMLSPIATFPTGRFQVFMFFDSTKQSTKFSCWDGKN